MRRIAAVLGGALVVVGALGPNPAAAGPEAVSCQQYDSHGICVVKADSDGGPAQPVTQPVAAGPDSDSGQATERNCTVALAGTVIPCQTADGWWVQSMQCYAQQAAEQPPKDAAVWGGRTDGAVYLCTYYTDGRSFPGTNGFTFWSATPPAGPAAVDPAVLAEQALDTLTIPAPTTGRYPAGLLQNGQSFTVVNAYTWFWTDPASFQPLTARADAGGVWSQVVVTPTALSFTPGDGADAVSCSGPGTVWQPTDGVWSPSPAGCHYRYPHSSIHQPDRQVTATYGVQWSVAWTSSTGASGTLPQLTTSSAATFAVAEAQAVVTR